MTDRYNALTIILESDIRDDDAQPLIEAIKQLRGVLSVEPHLATPEEAIAEARVRSELGKELLAVIWPNVYGKKEQA